MNLFMNKVATGDKLLIHTKGFSPISMAIRYLTCSYFNHIGQIVLLHDNWYVIEALMNQGIVKSPIDKYYDSDKFDIKVIRLKEEAFKNRAEYLQGIMCSNNRMIINIGKKYDFGAVVFIGIKYIWKSLFRHINRNWMQSREKFYCSEIVCESDYAISSLHSNFYEGKTKSNCSTTTPGDIARSPYVETVWGVEKV